MTNSVNVLSYLRNREGLSQNELAGITNINVMDISRMESGNLGAAIDKTMTLAEHFSVSLDSLLCNDTEALFASLNKSSETTRKMQRRIQNFRKINDVTGRLGEDWVFDLEKAKLAGTPYEHAICQNYANDYDAHFDILSFTPDGVPLYIEVKTTQSAPDKLFHLSAAELQKAEQCFLRGDLYQIHRVYYISDPEKRGRLIINFEQLYEHYELEPESYAVRRKGDTQ